MNAIEGALLDLTARADSLKKYYGLYLAETDPAIKAELRDILRHICRGIDADAILFLNELGKE